MIQPELGKKILDLRKAKGLTQEELVEKCNISVRTLQRIESGEVTPRSYTIRIIFAALDYNHADVIGKNNLISDGYAKASNSFSYFFNLKHNKMVKLSLLSIPFLVTVLALFFRYPTTTGAQHKTEVRAQILKLNADFIQTYNAGEMDSLSKLYVGDASLIMGNAIPVVFNNLPEVRGVLASNHFLHSTTSKTSASWKGDLRKRLFPIQW
ncbi:helix-turn-helix domain-containing protein [Pontibacter sp. SGAir0037]|uniref:helix-turn-helix domain-containing protein n=1 Tax=Pontibacter sp. SGAir0037 TaxID=2571030 RepID=UPI0010CCB473|nr:helix-turn-helix domain-containing protein [Pontibacter sp. SGAir0037]QCR23159.1 hypothetical protein C1N53_12935 [Pontibacter sp. SGAir0037]